MMSPPRPLPPPPERFPTRIPLVPPIPSRYRRGLEKSSTRMDSTAPGANRLYSAPTTAFTTSSSLGDFSRPYAKSHRPRPSEVSSVIQASSTSRPSPRSSTIQARVRSQAPPGSFADPISQTAANYNASPSRIKASFASGRVSMPVSRIPTPVGNSASGRQRSFFSLAKPMSTTPTRPPANRTIQNTKGTPLKQKAGPPATLPTPARSIKPKKTGQTPPTVIYKKNELQPQKVPVPVLPTQLHKENVPPARAHRLLGPVSPSGANIQSSRSRTMDMLSSITSTFSKTSSNSSHSRSISTNSLLRGQPTTAVDAAVAGACDISKPSDRQVRKAQLDLYWCGRVQALSDHFQFDEFQGALQDERSYDAIRSNKEVPPSRAFDRDARVAAGFESYEPYTVGVAVLKAAEEVRLQRVFIHLAALCITPVAKKSLHEFQTRFARTMKNDKLLPEGCHVEDKKDRGGWVNRLSRVVTPASGGANGVSAGLGRRTMNIAGSVFGRGV